MLFVWSTAWLRLLLIAAAWTLGEAWSSLGGRGGARRSLVTSNHKHNGTQEGSPPDLLHLSPHLTQCPFRVAPHHPLLHPHSTSSTLSLSLSSVSANKNMIQQGPHLQHGHRDASSNTAWMKLQNKFRRVRAAPPNQQQQQQSSPVVIASVGQFLNFVLPHNHHSDNNGVDDGQEGGDYRLKVVLYHAKWCKVCQRVKMRYRKIIKDMSQQTLPMLSSSTSSTESSEQQQNREKIVSFATVELTSNVHICRTLNICKVPFIEMYDYHGEKIASFSTGPAYKFNTLVRETIREKLSMSSHEQLQFRQVHANDIEEGTKLLNQLAALLV